MPYYKENLKEQELKLFGGHREILVTLKNNLEFYISIFSSYAFHNPKW
jgi:hypothetical protein